MNCTYYVDDTHPNVSIPCNPVKGSVNLVSGQVAYADYGYLVNPTSTYVFIALFGLASLIHALLGLYWRAWWTICTLAAGSAVETAGWGGRLWSLKSTYWEPNYGGWWEDNHNAFIMQICCLVIAPTFFSAANYILLGRLVRHTGHIYGSLTPKSFSILFILADFICLLVQAGGGAWAGIADSDEQANEGAKLMSAGVMIQLGVTVIFVFMLAEFIYRFSSDKHVRHQRDVFFWACCRTRRDKPSRTPSLAPTSRDLDKDLDLTGRGQFILERGNGSVDRDEMSRKKVWMMIGAIIGSTVLIIARSVFRSIELLKGWRGSLETDQGIFIALDASLMTILVTLYVGLHPGRMEGRRPF